MASVQIGPRTAYLQVAGMQAGVSTLSTVRIKDAGSLLLSRNGQTAIAINVILNTGQRRFTSGLGYCLIRMVDNLSASSSHQGFGFLLSTPDVTTSGSLYGAVFDIASGPSAVTPRIVKYTAGLSTTGTTLASASSLGNAVNGQILAVVVRWAYSVAYGPGVRIRMYAKFDASDLALPEYSDSTTPTCEVVDSSAPLSTSAGEGEILRLASSALNRQVSFDRVGRYAQVVGAV